MSPRWTAGFSRLRTGTWTAGFSRLFVLSLLLPVVSVAQEISLAHAAAKIDTAIPWITDGFYAADPGRPVATLPKIAADRNKLLDSALARAKEEKKLVLWYIPRIEGGHMVRPEFPDEYMRIVVFTNPDVCTLVNARFVPLRMAIDKPIGARMGIKRVDWVEPAIAILDAEGTIVHRLDRIRTFHAGFFHDFFLKASGGPPLVRDGSDPAKGLYDTAIAKLLRRDTSGAEKTFRAVVAKYGDVPEPSPWAAMAAGNLLRGRDTTFVGPAFHGYEDPAPLPAAAVAESRPSTAWPRPASEVDGAVKLAVAWLLKHQGENGGFEDARYAYCDTPRILPNVWVAITAIALAALDEWREVDPPGIDEAIALGEQYLFQPENLAPGRNEECYADSFRLAYLARRLSHLPAGSPDGRRLRGRMKDIAGALVDQQSERGLWAHEYPNAFCSAAALLALEQARQGGAAVPASVFEAGARGIDASRGSKGTFAYSFGRNGAETDEAFKNAMARMPICERALLIGAAKPDTTALEAALDNFEKWLPRFERIRVCDFHTDGELGGFFFWHGMFLTSEAMKALPAEKRAPHEQKMLEHVMKIGEIDGAFVDSHEMGKSYGTGMALLVLKNCISKP